MKTAVRLFSAALIAGVAILGGAMSSASAVTWRLTHKMPADSPEGKVHQRFAELVDKYSGGKLKIAVFPSEQLGKEASVLEQLQLGTIQIYCENAFFLQKWVPDIKWMSAPFLFKDREHWVHFVNTSPMVKSWFDQVEKKAGVIPLGHLTDVVRGPFRVLVSKRPIHSLEELRGLKIRMYPDQLATGIWNNLGAETRLLAWTEVYESIKSGVIEGVTSPIALVDSMRFYEVAPNVIRTDEFWQELAYMMNAKAFRSLSPELQQALLRAHKEAGEYSAGLMEQAAKDVVKSVQEHGAKYIEPDIKPWIARTAEFYDRENKEGRMPKGFLEAIAAAKTN
jgi:tripartite ATP-independent transporter DctP family solute receptor